MYMCTYALSLSLSLSTYHLLQDGLTGANRGGGLPDARGLAEEFRGCGLRPGGEGLLAEVVESDPTRLTLLWCLPVGQRAARGGKVHGVESSDVPHSLTACAGWGRKREIRVSIGLKTATLARFIVSQTFRAPYGTASNDKNMYTQQQSHTHILYAART